MEENTFELHYWFDDESHTMDAFIQNKCEYEILGIIKEIATNFNVDIIVETSPLEDGGLRRWFKIATKEENSKATITAAVIAAMLTSILVTPVTKVMEKGIEKIFEDKELIDTEKEIKKEQLKNLRLQNSKLEREQQFELLNNNNIIKKKKSNYYETLDNYRKVTHVSYKRNEGSKTIEIAVNRNTFKEYILVSDDLEPIIKEDAVIEIISPVLKKGFYKWMGIYNGETINFNMQSNEFKTLVQTGKIEFKNGSSINCILRQRKKIDNEGLEKTIGYDVLQVNSYFENDNPVETSEGRRFRQKKEADRQQLDMFDSKGEE